MASRKDENNYVIEQLYILLNAGMDVSTAVESLALEVRNHKLQDTLFEVKEKIDEGSAFWAAFEGTGVIPPQFLAFIRTGEQSGRLKEQLKMVAEQYSREKAFRSKVLAASIYPAFIFFMVVVLGGFNTIVILPNLTATFSKLDVELPWLTVMLLRAGAFLEVYGLIVVPALLVFISFVFYITFLAPRTKHIGQEILLRLPGIKNVVKEVELSKFGYIFGMLISTGTSVVDALQFLAEYSRMKRYQGLFSFLTEGVDNGMPFKILFKEFDNLDFLFPRSVQNLIVTAEQSGTLPDTLTKIGKIYQDKLDISTQTLSAVIEPLLIIIVWGFVLLLALSIIFPMYSIIGSISQF